MEASPIFVYFINTMIPKMTLLVSLAMQVTSEHLQEGPNRTMVYIIIMNLS